MLGGTIQVVCLILIRHGILQTSWEMSSAMDSADGNSMHAEAYTTSRRLALLNSQMNSQCPEESGE